MNAGKKINIIIIVIIFVNIIIFTFLIYPVLFSTPELNTNLIVNPGFESGATEPHKWTFVTKDANTPIWDNIHHNGSKSLKISVPGTTSRESGYAESDLIKVEPQHYYTFSAMGKTENVSETDGPAVWVVELDVNKRWIKNNSILFGKGTNEWAQKRIDFLTDSNTTYLYIYANIWKGYGTFWLDDVALKIINTKTFPQSPEQIFSSIYYVAINGNDNNPGTESQPWRTISKAANTLVAGETVYVKEGTYSEKISIQNSGLPGIYNTFAAYPGDNVTIDGMGLVSQWEGIFTVNGASHIKISGFNILHSGYAGVRVNGGGTSLDVIIEKNYFNDIYSSAIYTENAGPGIIYDSNEVTGSHKAAMSTEGEVVDMVNVNGFEIKNNYIHDNFHAESITAKEGASNGLIHHNNVKPVESAGIYLCAWTDIQQNIEVYDNIIHDGPGSSRGIAMAVEGGGSLTGIKVYNNIVYNNGASGINVAHYHTCDANSLCISGPIDNIQIVNNVVYNNGVVENWGGGINIQYGNTTKVIVSNNIVSQNRNYQIVNKAGVNATIINNLIDGYVGGEDETKGSDYIEGDPLFINPVNADFHLESTSPVIDKGTSTDAPSTDFDGTPRPQGAGYDIGAIEYKNEQ
ncbi:MAG: right-handed parallel beta-helix repeat-containing protein [Candidatus Methanoperedens sp.]